MATLSYGGPPSAETGTTSAMAKESWFEGFMNAWRHVIQVSERTLIDNVAATVPWLAPVSPAYMVWHNAVTILGWPTWVAWVMAMAVEGLGLSVVSTAFQLWKGRQRTFSLAVVTTVFYLATVITVNVALELGAPAWFAKALLSLLSIPAAVTIALRTSAAKDLEDRQAEELRAAEARRLDQDRFERLRLDEENRIYQRQVDAEERARRHELRLLKEQTKVSLGDQGLSESYPHGAETFGKVSAGMQGLSVSFGKKYADWRQVPESEREQIRNMSTHEIMAAYAVSERTAINWRNFANGKE